MVPILSTCFRAGIIALFAPATYHFFFSVRTTFALVAPQAVYKFWQISLMSATRYFCSFQAQQILGWTAQQLFNESAFAFPAQLKNEIDVGPRGKAPA